VATVDLNKFDFVVTGAAIVKKYTYSAKDSDVQGKWYVADANGAILGRLASHVASRLRGKLNPLFTPHADTGDFVIIINAEKVKLTGNKETQKEYMTYSGWRGGEKHRTVEQVRAKHPERLIEHAVKGMIPKNRLGRQLLTKLKVYAGPTHPHTAQQPAAKAA